MKIEIDEDIATSIIITELRNAIKYVKADIKRLKNLESRQSFEDIDLKDTKKMLKQLKAVYEYFGGNIHNSV